MGQTATVELKNDRRPNLTIHKTDADTDEPVPGTTFLPDTAAPCSAVRLNFSAPSNQQITDGIERLGKVLDRFLR